MKHLKALFCLIILGCAPDDPERNNFHEIHNISPLVAKIGDTIRLSGTNLNSLKAVTFFYEDNSHTPVKVRDLSFISRTNNEITLKIPVVSHENMIIKSSYNVNFKLDIVGTIPTINEFEKIDQIQVLDENIAFLLSNDKIYKSKDGFYNWSNQIDLPNKDITSFFFLNENIGWFGVMDNEGRSIYFTQDGGESLSLKYQINNLPNNTLDGSDIRKIQFISKNKGLFKDGNGNIFIASNDSFENIYDYYKNLSSLPFGKINFYDFNIINEDLIFLTPEFEPYLIKIYNENITYSEFNTSPLAPIFFGDIGYLKANNDIYKTEDLGNSWKKIKTFENHYPRIRFLDSLTGLAIVNYSPYELHITKDGGDSWEKSFTFHKYDYPYKGLGFSKINGMIGTPDGKTWKYRKE